MTRRGSVVKFHYIIAGTMLDPEEAWKRIAQRLTPLGPARVRRSAALGQVLAEDVAATVDMPQADVSAMDGYALAGETVAGDVWPVRGVAAAGRPPELTLSPGEAAKIMTGAVMPRGADRVIPVEETDAGGERVTLHAAPEPGRHVRRHGEVVERGAPLLAAGTRLTPGAISLLAAHGHEEIAVYRRPTVALLPTGDEVVAPDREPGPGQLRDSNSAFLAAAGSSMGLEFELLGIAPDRLDELRRMIVRGLGSDVLLLCGGVSMGEFDLVEDVIEALGCEKLFDRVAIQPGKPLVAAQHPGGWVLGLPGNPASVMVTFWLFARPLLRGLMGIDDGYGRGLLRAELAGPLPGSKGRARYLPATVHVDAGRLRVVPQAPRGSHDVSVYARGSALVRVPPQAKPRDSGPCQILPLVESLE